MIIINFNREYLGEWTREDPKYEIAYNLWIDYYYWTEKYDQRICSGRTEDGVAMPLGNREYILINQNATKLRRELNEKAFINGIDDDTLQRAKMNALRLPQHKVNEIYENRR